jgi:hypothetical protein
LIYNRAAYKEGSSREITAIKGRTKPKKAEESPEKTSVSLKCIFENTEQTVLHA